MNGKGWGVPLQQGAEVVEDDVGAVKEFAVEALLVVPLGTLWVEGSLKSVCTACSGYLLYSW